MMGAVRSAMVAVAIFAAPTFLAAAPGDRPAAIIAAMADSPLKTRLAACAGQAPRRTDFSIGHRGAPLAYPEHSVEGYRAAAAQGAGIVECDVTFLKDKTLVCRHSQNDLHTTTDILTTGLATTCLRLFSPATGGARASAECRASDLTIAQFMSLQAKPDNAARDAQTPEGYVGEGLRGTLVTHAQSIALLRDLGVKFTPELKAPVVGMPIDGLTRQHYAQALIDDYKTAGVPPGDVWPQSFNLADIRYWIEHEPAFGAQAVFLDGRYRQGLDPMRPETFSPSMAALKAEGVRYIAPPMWMLLTLDGERIVPSAYAIAAREAELRIIAWTLERSGDLTKGGGWYYRTLTSIISHDGMTYEALHVLAQDVGVVGVFSDWPETVTYYANCMGID